MILQRHPRYIRLFRKFKGHLTPIIRSNTYLRWGCLGLKVCEPGRLFYSEVEAARRTIQSAVKPYGKLYSIVPLDCNITRKSVGSRMGRGKGVIKNWYTPVASGTIIFEVKLVKRSGFNKIRNVMLFSRRKLSVETKLISGVISINVK